MIVGVGTATATAEGFSVKVYPNPAKAHGEAWLEFNQIPTESIQVKLMGAQGNVIQHFETKQKTNRLQLNGLTQGMYFIVVNTGQQSEVLKLLVE